MFQTFEQSVEWIEGRLMLGIKPGLHRMEKLMNKLGNPHRSKKYVHIGGTNGKGSTLTFLRSMLQSAGIATGSFTSPAFLHTTDRISLNGIPIPEEEWLALVNRIVPLAHDMDREGEGPTEFEILTAMMFTYFGEKEEVEVVLLEVGLGGRLDSTNIIDPVCSIITSIGMDHMAILGNTYEAIATEKAGIIKKERPVILHCDHEGARSVLKNTAREIGAPAVVLGEDVDYLSNGQSFTMDGEPYSVAMLGEHQIRNAALALLAIPFVEQALSIPVSIKDRQNGLRTAFWPGRMEKISDQPVVIMDGAHNREGLNSLKNAIQTAYPGAAVHVLFSAVADKDLDQMMPILDMWANTLAVTTFDHPRAASEKELVSFSDHSECKSTTVGQWLRAIPSNSNDVWIVTGSLYFLSSAYMEIKNYQFT